MSDSYTCAYCKGTFLKGWSDEEAAAERDAVWGLPESQCDLICEDCWQATVVKPGIVRLPGETLP